jgi:transposase
MTQLYVGQDVSFEQTAACIVDKGGRVIFESQVMYAPDAIPEELDRLGDLFTRIGFEEGPLSNWLVFGLTKTGLPAVCNKTHHAKAAMTAMYRNKNDGTMPARLPS